jgi:hypothetical protein
MTSTDECPMRCMIARGWAPYGPALIVLRFAEDELAVHLGGRFGDLHRRAKKIDSADSQGRDLVGPQTGVSSETY